MQGLVVLTRRLLYTPIGQTVVAAVLGFALALLFEETCDGARCVVVRSPPVDDVVGRRWKVPGEDAECAVFEARPAACVGTGKANLPRGVFQRSSS